MANIYLNTDGLELYKSTNGTNWTMIIGSSPYALAINTYYKLTAAVAAPASGQIFAGWTLINNIDDIIQLSSQTNNEITFNTLNQTWEYPEDITIYIKANYEDEDNFLLNKRGLKDVVSRLRHEFVSKDNDDFVKKTGDTMTGSLFIDAAEAYDLIKDKDRIGLAIGHPSYTKSLGAASVAISSADIVTDPNPEIYGETWYDCYALGDGSVAMGKNIFALGKSSFAQGAADSRSIYLKGEANATVYEAAYSWSFFPVDEHTYLMENNKIVAKVLSCNADPEQSAIAVVTVDKTLDENNAFNNRLFKVIYLSTKGEYSHAEGYGTCAEDRYSHAEGYKSVSSGQASHAEGYESISSGARSHAEGERTDSIGEGSHTEGYYTEAQKSYSHAEGCFTRAKGYYAHAEGGVSSDSFALQLTGEGNATTYTTTNTKGARIGDQVASSNHQMDGYWGNAIVTAVVENESITFNRTLSSSAISNKTYYLFYTAQAEGKVSHAEGGGTRAIGQGSHTEGQETIALKNYSHAEGFGSKTDGKYAHAEGKQTIASGESSHAEGAFIDTNSGVRLIGEGGVTTYTIGSSMGPGIKVGDFINKDSNTQIKIIDIGTDTITLEQTLSDTAINDKMYAVRCLSVASGDCSHAEGSGTFASGQISHAEGKQTTASGENSHAEGYGTTASNFYAHAEGRYTTALGINSHAEGYMTHAEGAISHTEGDHTRASGDSSHAEGSGTKAIGDYSHAEGKDTSASGSWSHAENYTTTASGESSHAEGYNTIAQRKSQHTEGEYNITDTTGSISTRGTYIHIVGNGTTNNARSNAHTLDWSGNAWFSGDVYTGSTSGTNKDSGSKKLATEEYVRNLLQEFATLNNLNMPD